MSKKYNSINLNGRTTQYSDFFENNMIFHENSEYERKADRFNLTT